MRWIYVTMITQDSRSSVCWAEGIVDYGRRRNAIGAEPKMNAKEVTKAMKKRREEKSVEMNVFVSFFVATYFFGARAKRRKEV